MDPNIHNRPTKNAYNMSHCGDVIHLPWQFDNQIKGTVWNMYPNALMKEVVQIYVFVTPETHDYLAQL